MPTRSAGPRHTAHDKAKIGREKVGSTSNGRRFGLVCASECRARNPKSTTAGVRPGIRGLSAAINAILASLHSYLGGGVRSSLGLRRFCPPGPQPEAVVVEGPARLPSGRFRHDGPRPA